MHKTFVIISLVSVVTVSPVLAQSGSDRISRPAPGRAPAPSTDRSRMADIAFTNNAGRTYTMADLTGRLRDLRTAVDQALPLLSAFNENYSNTVASQPGGLAGAISGILSGSRRNGRDQTGSSGRGSSALTNVVAVLNGLFGTNAPAAGSGATVNTNMVHDLLALEGELEPVAAVLRNMNLDSARGSSYYAGEEEPEDADEPEPPPTPTGRR